MREFEKWQKQFLQEKFVNRERMPSSIARDVANAVAGLTWRAALEWYQLAAEVCEKDCETPEDYKILYFHLKQVLKNEVKS